MQKNVKNAFSPAIPALIAFNLNPDHVIELDGFENFLFESEIEPGNFTIIS